MNDLNKKMAEECMGWKATFNTWGSQEDFDAGYFCWHDKSGKFVKHNGNGQPERDGWCPTSNISQAMECADKSEITIEKWNGRWRVEGGFNDEPMFCQFADLPRTICEVIEKALDAKKGKT